MTASSAASPGAPSLLCASAPPADLRPGEVVRGVHPVGSCAVERQYRGDGTPRQVEQRGQEDRLLTAQWFVGIDWASDAHEVCVLDREGRVCERRQVKHTAIALQAFVDALRARAQGDPATVAIGIEVPRGALVELLVERGFAVYAINPKQLDRFRDRFTAAGAKDDRRDALVVGDSLRTDPQAFRQVRLDQPLIIQLREWSRVDEDLGGELTRLANQLRDLVYRSAPGLLALCPAADEPWFWALLRDAPTPADQQRLSQRRLERLLRTHRIRRLEAGQGHEGFQHAGVYTAPGGGGGGAPPLQPPLPAVEPVPAPPRHPQAPPPALLRV